MPAMCQALTVLVGNGLRAKKSCTLYSYFIYTAQYKCVDVELSSNSVNSVTENQII